MEDQETDNQSINPVEIDELRAEVSKRNQMIMQSFISSWNSEDEVELISPDPLFYVVRPRKPHFSEDEVELISRDPQLSEDHGNNKQTYIDYISA